MPQLPSLAARAAHVTRLARLGYLLAWLLPLGAARAHAPATGAAPSVSVLRQLALPTSTSFAPTSGAAGTPVTLTGTNLAGATTVTVNGVAVTPTNVSAGSLTFVVPAGASATQSITVTTPSGTGPANTTFTVVLRVASTSPAANAVTAPTTNSATAVTFTEPVTLASAANLKVFSAQLGGKKAGTVAVAGTTASFAATAGTVRTNFMPGEVVSVTVPATITSAGGLAAQKRVYQFTTATGGTGRGFFLPGSNLSATGVSDVLAADFNNDGILDLVDNSDAGVIRLGTGGGNYGTASSLPGLVAGQIRGLTAGDLDNDGDLDLVATRTTGFIAVLRNDGTGAFTPLADAASSGNSARQPALGDVDGDGDLDLLVPVSNGTGAVGVYLNNGSGGFAAPTSVSGLGGAICVALGDVDNDGDLDFVVADFNNASVRVRLNTGNGTFSGGSDLMVDTPNTVVLADVNGDGASDLLTTANSVTELLVSLNNNDGTGSFAAAIGYTMAGPGSSLAVGDVDADGDLDAVASMNGVAGFTLLLNTGSGAFGPASAILTDNSKGSNLALADLDNDGDLDLAATSGTNPSMYVRLNQPPAPTLTAVAPNPAGRGQAITLTGTNLSNPTSLTINGADALPNILSNTGTSLVVRVPLTPTPTGTVSLTAGGVTVTRSFTVMAAPGNALALDGVSNEVLVPTAPTFGTGNLTIEAWVRIGTAATTYVAVGSVSSTGSYWLGILNGHAAISVSGPTAEGTTLISNNRWHHLAGVRNGSQLTIYVDGVAEGTVASSGAADPVASLGLGSFGNSSFFWPGRLDEVRLWNVVRTQPELRAAAYAPLVGNETGLVRYFNFDVGTPATASAGANAGLTTLYDLVAGVPGTLTGFTGTALTSGNTTSNWVRSYAMVVPTATAPTNLTATSFTATWTAPAVGAVTSYLLDVSASPTFTPAVTGSPFTIAASTTSRTVTGLTRSTTYYYRVRALNSALTPPDQGAYSFATIVATPLPVELVQFTATAEGRSAVRLAWATASEKNSQAFEVERSADGRTFARIGTVAAAGSSSAVRSYELLDARLPTGAALLYYRLKQVDADGTFSYSPVRTVALTGAAAGLALYPNPAPGGAATLTGAQPGAVVTVYDALGRPVTTASADAAGTAVLVLPAGTPAGVYVVRAGARAVRLTVE